MLHMGLQWSPSRSNMCVAAVYVRLNLSRESKYDQWATNSLLL